MRAVTLISGRPADAQPQHWYWVNLNDGNYMNISVPLSVSAIPARLIRLLHKQTAASRQTITMTLI
jgi:hypothetical protein